MAKSTGGGGRNPRGRGSIGDRNKVEIREGTAKEVRHFDMYDKANQGDILVAENEQGEIRAFAQVEGNQIFFLQSEGGGAGTQIVNQLKGQYDELVARNVGKSSAGYWLKVGFERGSSTGERAGEYDYNWYAD
jgi:hypothetical protein